MARRAFPWSPGVTSRDYWLQVNDCATLLIKGMGEDPERWKALIKHVGTLPEPSYQQFLARLGERADKLTDEDVRRDVSDTIRKTVALHRQFATANWALPEELIAGLEKVQQRFEPRDPVRKDAWLFGPRWQVLERLENKEERLEEARSTVIRATLDREGWQGILRFIEEVEAPEELGLAVAAMDLEGSDPRVLPDLLGSANIKVIRFAQGYARERFLKQGWGWVASLDLRRWSLEALGQFLLVLDFEWRTWQFVEELGADVSTWYWQRTGSLTVGRDEEDSAHAIGKFLEHGRASSAVAELGMALHHKHVFPPGLLMDVLRAWLDFEAHNDEAASVHGVKHNIDIVFQELQKATARPDTGVDLKRLAELEWACLALLDGYPTSPVTLHRLLGEEPRFFVDVLGLSRTKEKLTEKEEQAAQNARRLLISWQKAPGSRDAETVDEERLFAWTRQVRTLAEQRGLLEDCDSRIGQVLAYAPHEPDGSPCIPVRDALEEIGTNDVFDGFEVGIYNKRRVALKSSRDGGAQERALADQYRAFADQCRLDWPQTAASLRRVASWYDDQAHREDLTLEGEQF